jgi:CcmD family protein
MKFNAEGTAGSEALAAETLQPLDPAAMRDDVSGEPYLVAAYIVVWLIFFGYVFALRRSQNRLREEVASLEATLDDRIADGAPPGSLETG